MLVRSVRGVKTARILAELPGRRSIAGGVIDRDVRSSDRVATDF